MFSKPLMEGLERVVERREKAVLLHNRRGFAPFLMCRECGCVPTCNHCSTALTYHERTHTLQCHTCGSSWRVQPYPAPTSRCPKCGSRNLTKIERMNGYLSYSRVKGDTRLNDAKMAEIAERKSM